MKIIKLTQNKYTLVDDEDFNKLNKFKWNAMKNYKTFYVGYRIRNKYLDKCIYMHRIILNAPPNMQVDHINHNGLDNRKINLRLVKPRQNCQNRKPHLKTSSGYKGVSWHRDENKYQTQIRYKNRNINLGYFKSPRMAAVAYNIGALYYFGEYAYLNEIKP